ncbi:hypothetical protein [Lentilactobacillus rapi]|uniref:hypothetical protein n=1 Tax=Lentilactobacillus rapi TaxID=481723 RepID=UPI0006D1B5C0|nr:hypothetical protein [Lentilactobacillus rapi]
MKKILRFAKIIAMSVSVIWGAVLFGNVLTANADDTATETVNIVDTNGNTLRAPQTIPVGDGKNPINVNISGYDPAETLEKIDTTFVYPSGSDTPSGTITFTIDDDKQVAHITVSSGDESHDGGYQTKDDIEKDLGGEVTDNK